MTAGDLITAQWQVEWRGTLLGWPATNLVITNVTGLKPLPPMRSNPVDRPGRHGQIPSGMRASGRVVEVEFADLDDDPGAFEALLAVIAPGLDDGQEPLVVYLNDQPRLLYGRCENDDIPTDQAYTLGYRRGTLQFVCADPGVYSVGQYSQSIGLPQPLSGGLVFPLVFPLDFGSGRAATAMTLTNVGNTAAWPVFTIRGPVTGPIVAVGGGLLRFNPAYFLDVGRTLTIDTDWRTVIDDTGSSRRGDLYDVQWTPLYSKVPTTVTFNSVGAYDAGALLTAAWRDTSM